MQKKLNNHKYQINKPNLQHNNIKIMINLNKNKNHPNNLNNLNNPNNPKKSK